MSRNPGEQSKSAPSISQPEPSRGSQTFLHCEIPGAEVAFFTPSKLRGPRRVWLRVDDAARARAVLAAASVTCTPDGDDALWLDAGADVPLTTVQAMLSPAGVTVHEYANRQPSLEQALLARLRAKGAQPA